jgi:hypothetical protein
VVTLADTATAGAGGEVHSAGVGGAVLACRWSLKGALRCEGRPGDTGQSVRVSQPVDLEGRAAAQRDPRGGRRAHAAGGTRRPPRASAGEQQAAPRGLRQAKRPRGW